jgi:hypothetical protein
MEGNVMQHMSKIRFCDKYHIFTVFMTLLGHYNFWSHRLYILYKF